MYGKLYASMFDGSLHGNWQAIVAFQQLIVLCDSDGVVDATPRALASRTSIPLEIFEAGLPMLEAPDPHSRSKEEDGRRIVLIDPDRPWGWRIVNHKYYRGLRSREDIREADHDRQARARASRSVTPGHAASQHVASGHAGSNNADAHAETRSTTTPPAGRAAVPGPADQSIPLVDGSEFGLDASQFEELQRLYLAVDLGAQLRAMRGWCIANPKNRKTRAGALRFINGWLSREQNKARPVAASGGGHRSSADAAYAATNLTGGRS